MARSATFWFSRKEPDWREQTVDQRGLAVVDVGNDGDIAQVHEAHRLSSGGNWGALSTRSMQ
jgi:hypothetical protein